MWKIWDSRSVGNVSTNVCAKFRCAPLRIKKALGIFLENWYEEQLEEVEVEVEVCSV